MTIPVHENKKPTTVIISHRKARQMEFPFQEIYRHLTPKPRTMEEFGRLVVSVARCAADNPDTSFELDDDMLYLYRFGRRTGEALTDHWTAMFVPTNVVLPEEYRRAAYAGVSMPVPSGQLDLFPAGVQ
jgi:hypothetical protein